MKTLFIQIEEKKSGVKVTVWEQFFLYEESCHNVYLTKTIYKNGRKSTVAAFAKATGQEVPNLLKANTFFWRTPMKAEMRRRNEEMRNAELAEFSRENTEEAIKKLNDIFAEYLNVDEKILVDYRGAYLHTEDGDYQLHETITKKAIEDARMRIAETKKTLETV